MITKYKGLSDLDKQKVIEFYYLDPQKDAEDIAFIFAYREKLYDAMLYFWEATVSDKKANTDKGLDALVEVAKMVNAYMQTTNPDNARKRIHFLNLIEDEIRLCNFGILWGLHTYSGDSPKKIESMSKNLVNFLKHTATEGLLSVGDLKSLLDENTKIQVLQVKQGLREHVLEFAEEKFLSITDTYFVIAYCLDKIDQEEIKLDKIYKTKCSGCQKDDCMLPLCYEAEKKMESEKIIEKYKKVYDVCIKKITGEALSEKEIDSVVKTIKNEEVLSSMFSILMDADVKGSPCDRMPKIDITKIIKYKELMPWEKAKEVFAEGTPDEEQKTQTQVYLDGVLSLLLTSKISNVEIGDPIIEKFKRWYDEVEKFYEELSQRSIESFELRTKYDKIKKGSKEPGGE